MPSGAKKRKAAKKKKENLNQSHSHSDSASVHPHGDENVKHQEDRESDDAGEASSPTFQDSGELRIEAEREVRGTSSSLEGSRDDNGKQNVGVEESVVIIEKVKIVDELGVEDGSINRDEADRNSSDGDSSRSSSGSSSSDDESHGIKREQTVDPGDSVVPSTVSVAPCVVESALEENGVQKSSSVEESVCTSVNAASYGEEEEEAHAVRSAESSPRILDPNECATQENDDRSTPSCIDSRAAINNGAQHAKDSEATETVVATSPYPVQKTSWKSCCGLFEVFAGSGA